MEFRRETAIAEILHPGHDFEPVQSRVEIRWDPLTGHTGRVLLGVTLLPPSDFDVASLGRELEPTCPFCAPRLEAQTPRLPPSIHAEGRIRHGRAVLFPNLLAYSRYASVSVYDPERHFLPLEDLTPALVADNITTQVAFEDAVMRHDAEARWASINANHMLPSGSSVFHPHMQGSIDHFPTTFQRLLVDVTAERFAELLNTERRLGERFLADTGAVQWITSFAPMAPCEIRAFVPSVSSPVELDADLIAELAHGISAALGLYAELQYQSFNMAIYGAPRGTRGYPLNLRLACRSNPQPLYRSDVTYFERLHWEGAVDLAPEELAERAGDRFRR